MLCGTDASAESWLLKDDFHEDGESGESGGVVGDVEYECEYEYEVECEDEDEGDVSDGKEKLDIIAGMAIGTTNDVSQSSESHLSACESGYGHEKTVEDSHTVAISPE
jgi:hypothetical protein